jgi:hypothetical protein
MEFKLVTAKSTSASEIYALEKGIEVHDLCLTSQTRKKKKTRSHLKTSKFRLSQNRPLVLSLEPRLVV